ncbi:uncharacterized protein ARMOST_21734 [Armillaria ostoyae]|uniref:BZIP domain-containing protein n=1 Tax=Armillaria ostoyae TaxID=47428 RepID=A0A284SB12_ARMOS|nr:uncharacterized protein ARMOST_21734 [Armillaria ostoyae]
MSRHSESFEFGSFGPVGSIMGATHGAVNPGLIFGGGGSAANNADAIDPAVNQNISPITPHQMQGPFAQGQGPTMYNMGPPFPQNTPQLNHRVVHVGDVAHGVWRYDPLTLSWSHSECDLCRTYRHHISDAEYDQVPSFMEARAQVSPPNKGGNREQELEDEIARLRSENARLREERDASTAKNRRWAESVQECEIEIRHLRDELQSRGPPPNRFKRARERGDSPPPQRIRTERGYRPSPSNSSRTDSPWGNRPPPHAPPPPAHRGSNDAMEVDDVGSQPAPSTSCTLAGPHAFIPYESPLNKSKGGLFGSHQATPPSYNESDSDDDSDGEQRDEDIKKSLQKFPHANRSGPKSLTSGWDYYQKYQPVSKSAFRTLNPNKKDLPPPTGKLRRVEPHLPTTADEAERIITLVKASPDTFLAFRWKHIVSDLQTRARLGANSWTRGSVLSPGTYWLLAHWPSGVGTDKKGNDIPFGPARIQMPLKAAPAADWFSWCLWNHRPVDCPGVFIMRDGPIICSTVEAWRLSRDLTPAQVANPRLRTRFTEIFVMLALRPGWYGQFLDHHTISVASEYDPYTRFPGNWIQNLDLAALSRFLAERGVSRESMNSYLLFGKTWATCMLSLRPNQSSYWQQQLDASHDWIKASGYVEPSWYDTPSWSPPLNEGWDLAWIAKYRQGRMDKWVHEHRSDAPATNAIPDLPPAAVVPPDVASAGLSGVGGDLSVALNTGTTSAAGPSNSGPPTESKVIPIAPHATDAPPDSGAPSSEAASRDTPVPDSSSGTVGNVDNGNRQVDDGGDTIMVDPDLQLAASVPLPSDDKGL